MEQIIVIFKALDDEINHACMIPNPEYDLEWICKRDVPQGQPYCIISASMLPNGYFKERGFYDFNFQNPTGWGSGSTELYGGNLPLLFTASHSEWLEIKASSSL
jgi:hypothetical protein